MPSSRGCWHLVGNPAEQLPNVAALLGGDVSTEWIEVPERRAIVIATQDMALSRALNRGYAMSRFLWPMAFGAISNDVLYVVDEVQLHGVGATTAAQLQGLSERERFGTFGKHRTVFVSATIDESRIDTVDHPLAQQVRQNGRHALEADDIADATVAALLSAEKPVERIITTDERAAADAVLRVHVPGTLTLVVACTRGYWICLQTRAWLACAGGDLAQARADLDELALRLDDETDPDGVDRRKNAIVAAEVAFLEEDAEKAVALLMPSLALLADVPRFERLELRTNLAWYHVALNHRDVALHLAREILDDIPHRGDFTEQYDTHFQILIPVAAVAAMNAKARLGAMILGHCKQHWSKRIGLTAHVPTYTKLVASLDDALSADEMTTLFDEGAALRAEHVFRRVRMDALFAVSV